MTTKKATETEDKKELYQLREKLREVAGDTTSYVLATGNHRYATKAISEADRWARLSILNADIKTETSWIQLDPRCPDGEVLPLTVALKREIRHLETKLGLKPKCHS